MNIPVTKNSLTRLIVFTVGSFIAAFAVPAAAASRAEGAYLAVAIFTGTMLSFLVFQAAERRRVLLMTVALELNKLRRIYHLAKNMAESSQRFRGWFTDLHANLTSYLSFFSGKKFSDYDDSAAEFRKLSYHIYTIPEVESRKEQALYEDLLKTTAIIAESRQNIHQIWNARLSAYSWVVVLLMDLGFVITALLAMTDSLAARLAGGISIATAFLAVDLLWEVDTLSSEERELARRYVDNIAKLQLSRQRS